MGEYKYKLQYFDDGIMVTHEFPADINSEDLAYRLRDFLLGCSWQEETVNKMFTLFSDESCSGG